MLGSGWCILSQSPTWVVRKFALHKHHPGSEANIMKYGIQERHYLASEYHVQKFPSPMVSDSQANQLGNREKRLI